MQVYESTVSSTFISKLSGHLSQVTRYGIVGLVALFFDYSVLVLLTEYLQVNHLISATAGFFVGLIVNYALATRFVFKEGKLSNKKLEFIIFSIIGAGGLLFTIGLMWLLTDVLEIHYTISKAVAVGTVFLWNFYARKYILFKD